jgi:hypothetical protein
MSDFFDFGHIYFTNAVSKNPVSVLPSDVVEREPDTVDGVACTKLTTRDADGTIFVHYVTESVDQVTKSIKDAMGDKAQF